MKPIIIKIDKLIKNFSFAGQAEASKEVISRIITDALLEVVNNVNSLEIEKTGATEKHTLNIKHSETFTCRVSELKNIKKYLTKKEKQLPEGTALHICLVVAEFTS